MGGSGILLDSNVKKEREDTVSSITSSLLGQVQVNDRNAWDQLVKLYGPLVYRWGRQKGLSGEDAGDVSQDVFKAVARAIPQFSRNRPGATFVGWLHTVTKNKIHDHWKKNNQAPVAPGGSEAQKQLAQVPEHHDDDDDIDATRLLFEQVMQFAKEQIKPEYWEVFWRVVAREESPADVARDLKMERANVYIIKSRVMKMLRESMVG